MKKEISIQDRARIDVFREWDLTPNPSTTYTTEQDFRNRATYQENKTAQNRKVMTDFQALDRGVY